MTPDEEIAPQEAQPSEEPGMAQESEAGATPEASELYDPESPELRAEETPGSAQQSGAVTTPKASERPAPKPARKRVEPEEEPLIVQVPRDNMEGAASLPQRHTVKHRGRVRGTVVFVGDPASLRTKVAMSSNQGIQGIGVSLKSPERSYETVTDEEGNFIFPNVPAGTYTVQTQHKSLGELATNVVVPDAGIVAVNFKYKWWSK
jgi:hypothetical protein